MANSNAVNLKGCLLLLSGVPCGYWMRLNTVCLGLWLTLAHFPLHATPSHKKKGLWNKEKMLSRHNNILIARTTVYYRATVCQKLNYPCLQKRRLAYREMKLWAKSHKKLAGRRPAMWTQCDWLQTWIRPQSNPAFLQQLMKDLPGQSMLKISLLTGFKKKKKKKKRKQIK